MAEYLIHIDAYEGSSSIIRDLSDDEAAFVRQLAEDLTRGAGSDGPAVTIRPISECSEYEVRNSLRLPLPTHPD